jgi:hypothetical protein
MIAPPGFDDCAPRPRWLLPQAGPDCQGQGQHQVQRHERGQFIRLPFAALAEKENPGSPDGARGSLLPVEAAGIEPAAGGIRRKHSRAFEGGFRRSSSRLRHPLPHAELR